MPEFEIRADECQSPEVIALLEEHWAFANQHSPDGCVHALNLAELRKPDVTFLTVWQSTTLAGCGALKEIDPAHGELKSMRTSLAFLRRGVASLLIEAMIRIARDRGYTRLSLETGSNEAFAPARALYHNFGFQETEPFAEYRDNGFSIFMTKSLAPNNL